MDKASDAKSRHVTATTSAMGGMNHLRAIIWATLLGAIVVGGLSFLEVLILDRASSAQPASLARAVQQYATSSAGPYFASMGALLGCVFGCAGSSAAGSEVRRREIAERPASCS
jgi:hypothetical protein